MSSVNAKNKEASSLDTAQLSDKAQDAVRLLKALANEQRLMVLCMLVDQELSVSEINEKVDLSQPALSQHLALLREDGLVNTRREGQTIYYSLPAGPALEIIHTLHSLYCKT